MNFHEEILGRRQRAILQRLGAIASSKKFYLGGGTALALHLGHRRSQDFDWFTAVSGIRVTFLEYRYDVLQPLLPWSRYGVNLASKADLGTMKLVALGQRGAKKDFVDLFSLCNGAAPLSELLNLYRERYQVRDIAHVLYSLAYFDDADKERMPKMLRRITWPDIKRAIRKWVDELGRPE